MKYLMIIAFFLTACGHKTDVTMPKINVEPPAPTKINNELPDGPL